MKIAVYYNLPFSGAKRTVQEHVKGLKKLGHSIDVYTIDSESDIFDPGKHADNEFRYEYRKQIFKVPFLKKFTNDLSDFYLLKSLHKKIATDIDGRGYDLALIHTDKFTQAPFILRFLKTKNVYFCLEPLKIAYEYGLRFQAKSSVSHRIYEIINRKVRKKIDRDNARSADFTMSISYFGRELMIQSFDVYPKVSHLGVDTEKFKRTRMFKKNQVLFLGQKLKMNGYDSAVEALRLIPESKRPRLKMLSIKDNNNDRLSDKDMLGLYNESKITLSLSNLDTFGLVAIESQACEVPVVAFNVAGYRETVIDGKTGFLVDFDPQEIAKKIMYLLDNPKIAGEMGKEGRDWVIKNWTWEKQIGQLDNYLQKISEK